MSDQLIFVTTGTQFPFDRLIKQVDEWAGGINDIEVIAQTAKSEQTFSNIETVDFLSPQAYEEYITRASVIIGHAGMGTIITGFEQKKPVILMARKLQFGEHRNDHQQSTVDKFTGIKGIYIANDETELAELLNQYELLEPACEERTESRDKLIDYLSNAIEGQ